MNMTEFNWRWNYRLAMMPVLLVAIIRDSSLPLEAGTTVPEVEWSTHLGGQDNERHSDIALDSFGNILVTGVTSSKDWLSGFDASSEGDRRAFVAKLQQTGTLSWVTPLGDKDIFGTSSPSAVTVDRLNNVFIVGSGDSSTPLT